MCIRDRCNFGYRSNISKLPGAGYNATSKRNIKNSTNQASALQTTRGILHPHRFHYSCPDAILHSVTDLLSSNPYVIVMALDFSKALDSIRYSTLMQKAAMLEIPDAASLYNWLVDFFSDRRHCTRYSGSLVQHPRCSTSQLVSSKGL